MAFAQCVRADSSSTQTGNRASIVSDTNEPTITNDWWNTIGFQSYLPAASR